MESAVPGHVCVLYTGGTIGMRSIDPALRPDEPPMLSIEDIRAALRQRSDLPVDYDFQPLLGDSEPFEPRVSSQIRPVHWTQIARTIQQRYADYDGFVVLHGTDTMAWTASALSFMFSNLSKPIVLTGSQRPIAAAPSDAVPNFVNAVMVAGRGHESIPLIPEVVICFGDLVLRGNRARKVSAVSLQGFDSPNAPYLGRVGRRFDINANHIRPLPDRADACFTRLRLEDRVADVLMYPGMGASQIARALDGNAGAVLRTFGAGNAPGGREVEDVLQHFVGEGMVLVNVTQTAEGTVEAGMLTGSRALMDCGVLTGLDLTAEAALTKLMVLLGSEPRSVVAEQMQLDQRGEQSMDLAELRASSQAGAQDGVSRIVLTRSLHARAHRERLSSAVLRLRGAVPDDAPPSTVALSLNHWWADHGSEPDVRSLGSYDVRQDTAGRWREIVVDVTEACRQVLQTGAPVTLTVVASPPGAWNLDVVLSLFMGRVGTELS